jgi:protein-S-isoprenylcysteine O-methyltransferase Ste14
MLAIFVLAGLDHRWGWSSEMTFAWRIVGIHGLLCVTRPLATWAMSVNRYWSGAVYVQESIGHQVCDVGPYQFVRHPAYLAAVFQWIWPPLMLGSWWSLIPAFLVSTIVVIRTYPEDEFLQTELEGYPAYTKKVKYRLVPGIW